MGKEKVKSPISKDQYEELLDSFREVSEEDLDAVVGGNDDPKGKSKEGVPWTCPFCGERKTLFHAQDGPKHMTQECPNNPYK